MCIATIRKTTICLRWMCTRNVVWAFAVRALHALALHALRATGDGRPPDRSSSRSIFPVRVSPLSLDTFVTSDKDVEDERSPPCGANGVARLSLCRSPFTPLA